MLLDLHEGWTIERRSDGALVVRVPSRRDAPRTNVDAVFSFRQGDPQYGYWDEYFRLREHSKR